MAANQTKNGDAKPEPERHIFCTYLYSPLLLSVLYAIADVLFILHIIVSIQSTP